MPQLLPSIHRHKLVNGKRPSQRFSHVLLADDEAHDVLTISFPDVHPEHKADNMKTKHCSGAKGYSVIR